MRYGRRQFLCSPITTIMNSKAAKRELTKKKRLEKLNTEKTRDLDINIKTPASVPTRASEPSLLVTVKLENVISDCKAKVEKIAKDCRAQNFKFR